MSWYWLLALTSHITSSLLVIVARIVTALVMKIKYIAYVNN